MGRDFQKIGHESADEVFWWGNIFSTWNWWKTNTPEKLLPKTVIFTFRLTLTDPKKKGYSYFLSPGKTELLKCEQFLKILSFSSHQLRSDSFQTKDLVLCLFLCVCQIVAKQKIKAHFGVDIELSLSLLCWLPGLAVWRSQLTGDSGENSFWVGRTRERPPLSGSLRSCKTGGTPFNMSFQGRKCRLNHTEGSIGRKSQDCCQWDQMLFSEANLWKRDQLKLQTDRKSYTRGDNKEKETFTKIIETIGSIDHWKWGNLCPKKPNIFISVELRALQKETQGPTPAQWQVTVIQICGLLSFKPRRTPWCCGSRWTILRKEREG